MHDWLCSFTTRHEKICARSVRRGLKLTVTSSPERFRISVRYPSDSVGDAGGTGGEDQQVDPMTLIRQRWRVPPRRRNGSLG